MKDLSDTASRAPSRPVAIAAWRGGRWQWDQGAARSTPAPWLLSEQRVKRKQV